MLDTILSRQQRGPVAVFDPQGVVGWPEQARWDPVAGCTDPDVALTRGKAWAAAQPMEGATNASWFSDRAATVLSCLLHAAALAGLSMREVAAWASNLSVTEEPVTILANHPGAAAGWDKKLRGQVAVPLGHHRGVDRDDSVGAAGPAVQPPGDGQRCARGTATKAWTWRT